MRRISPITIVTMAVAACGGVTPSAVPTRAGPVAAAVPAGVPAAVPGGAAPTPDAPPDAAAAGGAGKDNTFVLGTSDSAHRAQPSKIKPTATEAAVKFIVIDKDKGPHKGVVISLTAPDGKKYYTDETDAEGHAEVLVPVGQTYELVYLSLGRQNIAAKVTVSNEPNQNVKLTLRYKSPPPAPRFVLGGVNFDSGTATIRADSFSRLDIVGEFMAHKKSARLEIAGHTDNVGNSKANKALSQKRAQACRDYLISKGIDAGRITAVGYGDERPIAANDTEAGRQQNRRIEAAEM